MTVPVAIATVAVVIVAVMIVVTVVIVVVMATLAMVMVAAAWQWCKGDVGHEWVNQWWAGRVTSAMLRPLLMFHAGGMLNVTAGSQRRGRPPGAWRCGLVPAS